MALYAGAFDERVALTIPEESGGGGEASWRFMATQTGTEDLDAAQGTAWYAQNLLQFKNADAPKLPVDEHELVAMVAPRAILAVENTGIDRLGSQAGSVSMKAATEVYKALGVPDRIGFTQAGASAHCSFPSSQTADVQAFVDKFLARQDEREHEHREELVQHRPHEVDHLDDADAAVAPDQMRSHDDSDRYALPPSAAGRLRVAADPRRARGRRRRRAAAARGQRLAPVRRTGRQAGAGRRSRGGRSGVGGRGARARPGRRTPPAPPARSVAEVRADGGGAWHRAGGQRLGAAAAPAQRRQPARAGAARGAGSE